MLIWFGSKWNSYPSLSSLIPLSYISPSLSLPFEKERKSDRENGGKNNCINGQWIERCWCVYNNRAYRAWVSNYIPLHTMWSNYLCYIPQMAVLGAYIHNYGDIVILTGRTLFRWPYKVTTTHHIHHSIQENFPSGNCLYWHNSPKKLLLNKTIITHGFWLVNSTTVS